MIENHSCGGCSRIAPGRPREVYGRLHDRSVVICLPFTVVPLPKAKPQTSHIWSHVASAVSSLMIENHSCGGCSRIALGRPRDVLGRLHDRSKGIFWPLTVVPLPLRSPTTIRQGNHDQKSELRGCSRIVLGRPREVPGRLHDHSVGIC